MGRHNNNSVSRYVLIACLGITLLFGQVFKLHMHIQHDGAPASAGHVVDVHAAFSLHDTTYDTHHQDDNQNHHPADIKVSPDSVVKKTQFFNPIVLLFLIAGVILCVPRLQRIRSRYIIKTKLDSLYYLLYPPLRAPPV